jgi:hypothetical protein
VGRLAVGRFAVALVTQKVTRGFQQHCVEFRGYLQASCAQLALAGYGLGRHCCRVSASACHSGAHAASLRRWLRSKALWLVLQPHLEVVLSICPSLWYAGGCTATTLVERAELVSGTYILLGVLQVLLRPWCFFCAVCRPLCSMLHSWCLHKQ